MSLTDTAIRKAKDPGKLTDGGGLYLLITAAGGKWWRLDYRRPMTGKRNTLSLGIYPETSLAEARAKREEAKKLLKDGIDPGEQRKAEKLAGAERAANTFEAVALEWLAKQSGVPGYLVKVTAWFEKDVFPWIGARPVADLRAPEFLAVVQRVEQRGAIESAHRILQNCGQVMRYACATGRATSNPIPNLRGSLTAAPEKHHAAITDPVAIGALMRAIEGYKGSLVTRCALRLAPLLFVRPGELRNAEWAEIDFAAAEWRIPAEKMKMREPHLVPLCRQAVDILRELHPLTGRGRYVFPSGRGGDRPLSNNAVLAALRRMGYAKDEMTGHGFRAIACTVLDEVLGFRPDFIEHQLAHAVRDANGRAYNRTLYLRQRGNDAGMGGDTPKRKPSGHNASSFSLLAKRYFIRHARAPVFCACRNMPPLSVCLPAGKCLSVTTCSLPVSFAIPAPHFWGHSSMAFLIPPPIPHTSRDCGKPFETFRNEKTRMWRAF